MFITEYTHPLPADRGIVPIRRDAAERDSFWERFRSLVLKGLLSRKQACSALTSFPLTLELARGKTVWVCNDKGVSLECHSGVLWVTEGGERDLVLKSGESLAVHSHQRALVHALQDARLTLRPHGSPA